MVVLAKDGEALYSQQKQAWELTVAQIMNSLLPQDNDTRSQKLRAFHSKHSLPTTQEMALQMDITRLSIQKSD